MTRQAVQSSELSRNSAAVFAAAEVGPLTITRRDGADFVLTRADELDAERRALAVAADLVAASLGAPDQALAERLRQQFPWVGFLAPHDRETFAVEIVDVTRACASVGRFARLLVTFDAWRATAESVAAGLADDADLDWLEPGEPVADPRDAT